MRSKTPLYYIIGFSFLLINEGVAAFGKTDLLPENKSVDGTGLGSGTSALDTVFIFVKDSLFALLAIIVISMLIFIGFRLIMARGNSEEFSKSMKSLMFVIIGIFAVTLSRGAIKLIAGLDIK